NPSVDDRQYRSPHRNQTLATWRLSGCAGQRHDASTESRLPRSPAAPIAYGRDVAGARAAAWRTERSNSAVRTFRSARVGANLAVWGEPMAVFTLLWLRARETCHRGGDATGPRCVRKFAAVITERSGPLAKKTLEQTVDATDGNMSRRRQKSPGGDEAGPSPARRSAPRS